MEQTAIFDTKVVLTSKDMNLVNENNSIDSILIKHLRTKMDGKCSVHGWVIPNTLNILSRTMGQLENGRFTGNIIFHIQAEGNIYNPANGTTVSGTVLLKNHNGIMFIYENAIKVMIVRDLQIGNASFDSIQKGDKITAKILKSRFQVNDEFILSVADLVATQAYNPNASFEQTTEEVPAPAVEEEVVAPAPADNTDPFKAPTGNVNISL